MSLLGSILGSDSSLVGSFSDGYGHCCPPVFDPYTLVALLGGIALATFFLQRVIVGTTFGRSFRDFNIFGEYTTNADPEIIFKFLFQPI